LLQKMSIKILPVMAFKSPFLYTDD
jgi:hypothetical protein